MLDFIKNTLNTLAGPMASVVDFAGDKLGLPPLLTNSIKAVAGVATGNVMMAASGAMGVMSELQKNPPAQTEFCPSPDPAKAQEGYAKPTHTAAPAAPASGSAATTGSTPARDSNKGQLDPSYLEYRDALKTIAANYALLDTLNGSRNEKINVRTLEMAVTWPNLPSELKEAARFLVAHPEFRNMLDTAGEGGRVDGTISQKDVQKALKQVNDDIAKYGVRDTASPAPSTPAPAPAPAPSTPPVSGSPPPGKPGTPGECTPAPAPKPSPSPAPERSGVNDIINNPHMSLEEKIQAILMLITRDTDDEILDVMKEMSSIREERAGLGTDEKSRTKDAKLETTFQELNLRLQKLMEKRKQMFDLMSTLSSKFNEMAKVAIQNMGRA
ncbi:MAG TPA: hypothetical protein VF815_30580 [Myxococcaceae bacterium]|jgi:hypothetical protein